MSRKIFSIFFIILISVPLIDTITPFLPRTQLHGLGNTAYLPDFDYKQWLKHKYQARLENYTLKRPALWSWAVKANNELTLRLFKQLTTDYGISVQLGNHDHFIQNLYYNYFNRYKKTEQAIVRKKIAQLKKLQEHFKASNLPVISLISPNVFSLYPEVFPKRYRNPKLNEKYIKSRPTNYELAEMFIDKFQPEVVDAYKLLEAEKNNFPFRFFHTTASHWNDVASCLATEAILNKFNETWKREDLPKLPCRSYEMRNPPHNDDLDLLKVANLLFPEAHHQPAPYIKLDPERKLPEKPVRILVIGTSFLFAIQKQLIQNKISTEVPLYFYFRSARKTDRDGFKELNKEKIDWENLSKNFDGIVIESNVSNVSKMGYGFIETAVKKFNLNIDLDESSGDNK